MSEGLLVRHFVRRFVDNDLISPDADRHAVLAVIVAGCSMSGLFLTVFLSMRYLFKPLQSRGYTALVSLEDTFIWCGVSMIVMAFGAVAAWDALTLDARDTAILSVLPVRRLRVVGAQLAALLIVVAGLLVCVTLIPTLIAPLVRVSRLPIGLSGIARLTGAHAAATTAAGVFGFVAVVAIRELLRAVLAAGWFERLAPLVLGLLVAALATSFLLLPAMAADMGRRWLSEPRAVSPPPMWFVGLHERLAGDALVGLPPTEPPADAPAAAAIRRAEARMMRRYESHRPALATLARLSLVWLGAVGALAAALGAWNSRRWPAFTRAPIGSAGSIRMRLVAGIERLITRAPAERAGFALARQTLARSAPHRVRLGAVLGAAVAIAAFSLRGLPIETSAAAGELLVRAVAMQTLVLIVVAAGYRQTTRVPADLGAGVTFEIAGFDDTRAFVEGVKRAGVILVGCPVLGVLWPLHLSVLGAAVASAHLLCGVLVLLALVEVTFLRIGDLPFVSPREPDGNVLALGTIYAVLALAVAWTMARLERLAFDSPQRVAALAAALLGIWMALALFNRRGGARHALLAGGLRANSATQWMGLGE